MVVFCAYSLPRLINNRQRFQELFNFLADSVFFDIYVVDNLGNDLIKKELSKYTLKQKNITIINGTNTFAEFSAWLEAINYSDNKNIKYDSYILLNDTIYSHYGFYFERLIRFLDFSANFGKDSPEAVGSVFQVGTSKVFDIDYKESICTAAFAFNNQAKQFFKETCEKSFNAWNKKNTELDGQELINFYFKGEQQASIYKHLFGGGWYNSKPFEEFDKELLRLKLTAIVCEHYFSAKVVHMHGKIHELKHISTFKALKGITKKFGINFTLKILTKFICNKIKNNVQNKN